MIGYGECVTISDVKKVKLKPAPIFKIGDTVEAGDGSVFKINFMLEYYGEARYGFLPKRGSHRLTLEDLPFYSGYELKLIGQKKKVVKK